MTRIWEPTDGHNIIQNYLAGESINKLASQRGVSRDAVRNFLVKSGIDIRGLDKSQPIMYERMSNETRMSMTEAAHTALRGTHKTKDIKIAHALSVQSKQLGVMFAETQLANWLRDSGLGIVQQRAVDIYNLDIAIEELRIAVEIFGGTWHSSGEHALRFFERTKYLLDQRWHVVIIWTDAKRYPIGIGSAHYLIALCDQVRRSPPARSQYRVIRGDGQTQSAARRYFNTLTDIERLGSG